MSHNIHTETYPLNVNKRAVQAHMDEIVIHEDWQEGASGTPTDIRWLDRTFETLEDAENFIEEEDKRIWYNCMAVKYKSIPEEAVRKSKPTKKEADLTSAINAQSENIKKIIAQASIQNRTSEYIGCEECGSKLKRVLLRSEYCPLCRADLRSKTNIERINNAQKKLDELKKRCKAETDKRLAALAKIKHEVRWLVKIEYHT